MNAKYILKNNRGENLAELAGQDGVIAPSTAIRKFKKKYETKNCYIIREFVDGSSLMMHHYRT